MRRGRPTASARCSTRSIAHVETCEWTVEALDAAAGRSTRSASSRARSMPALYAAVEGRHRGPAAVRLDAPARPRTHRSPGSRAARDSARTRLTRDRSAKSDRPIRGWCNRQHNRFWSCLWGFESSPPSSQQCSSSASAPSSSGLGRRPLKAVTAVRICSGLHHGARLAGVGLLSSSGRIGARSRACARVRRRRSDRVVAGRARFALVVRAHFVHARRASHAARACTRRGSMSYVARARAKRMRVRYPPLRDVRCRTLVASSRACARTRVLSTIEYDDREAGNTQNATSQRTCDGAANMNFVRTRDVEMLDVSS